MAETAEDAAAICIRLAPGVGTCTISVSGLPQLEVDAIGDHPHLGLRMQCCDLVSLLSSDRADGSRPDDGVVEHGAAAGIEETRVELIAAQECNQRSVEPGRERGCAGDRH